MASFNSAFASARKAGKKTFTWNGKSYTTKLASETKKSKTPKNVPVPKARPSKEAPKERARADYPKPSKPSGIAKANSPLANAAAKRANAPRKNTDPSADYWKSKDNPKQGPSPEGVWYARKGSPMSIAAAKRANRPRKTAAKNGGGGW